VYYFYLILFSPRISLAIVFFFSFLFRFLFHYLQFLRRFLRVSFIMVRRYIWESKADGNFAVTEDTENEPLGRGTEIRIYLKSDAAEYAQEDKLRVGG
jgi:hypothetical protein